MPNYKKLSTEELVILSLHPALLEHSELVLVLVAGLHIAVVFLDALVSVSGEHSHIHEYQQH